MVLLKGKTQQYCFGTSQSSHLLELL